MWGHYTFEVHRMCTRFIVLTLAITKTYGTKCYSCKTPISENDTFYDCIINNYGTEIDCPFGCFSKIWYLANDEIDQNDEIFLIERGCDFYNSSNHKKCEVKRNKRICNSFCNGDLCNTDLPTKNNVVENDDKIKEINDQCIECEEGEHQACQNVISCIIM